MQETTVSQWALDLVFTIGGLLSVIVVIGILLLFLYFMFDIENKREEYIKTLNDHDKAVLMTYKSINPRIYFKKKGNKKQ